MTLTALQVDVFTGSNDTWQDVLEGFSDHRIYHTLEWFSFIEATQTVERLIYEIKNHDEVFGYLPGFIVRKGPLKIFASPFEGWYTPYMGVLLKQGVDVSKIMQAIYHRLKDDGFHFAQFTPPTCADEIIKECSFKVQAGRTYIAKIGSGPEEVLANFRKSTRYNTRRAIREGLEVRFTTDRAFVDVFYEQLCQVFSKSNMRPTYSKEKVEILWDTFMPTGKLFATEVRYRDKIIATRLEILYRDWMYAHGSASDQSYLRFKPNELARYHVMSFAANNGVKYYDMMGGGTYKAQFGGKEVTITKAVYDPYRLLGLKNLAKRLIKMQFKYRKKGK